MNPNIMNSIFKDIAGPARAQVALGAWTGSSQAARLAAARAGRQDSQGMPDWQQPGWIACGAWPPGRRPGDQAARLAWQAVLTWPVMI